MNSTISRDLPIGSLIKMRPMAIGLLEKRKIRFWDSLHKPVGEVFRSESMVDFLEEVSFIRMAAPDTDWSAMPLYFLVDYLTKEHRDIFLQEVPDIAHLLDIHTLATSSESEALLAIQKSFNAFVRDFEAHVEEEENHIFPKILRYEACMRDRSVHPEFHRGSLRNYMAAPKARGDQHFLQEGQELVNKTKELESRYPDSIVAEELSNLTLALCDKLLRHHKLESASLFSMGLELERSLYNLSIDGNPGMVYPRRGPMDSGIMRLDEA